MFDLLRDWSNSVSPEGVRKLLKLEFIVRKWNDTINLVSPASLSHFYERHVVDGLALWRVGYQDGPWVDMGSGAGFPGLIISIMGHPDVRLVESDHRKCAFLRNVCRELQLNCTVINSRIEQLEDQEAKTISARGLATLPKLLSLLHPHYTPGCTLYLLKGKSWKSEAAAADADWLYDLDEQKIDEVGSVILKICNLRPRNL